ncbi:MAG: hypothetical protein ACJ768_15235 [Gaiellaceae bacterium]
MAHVRDLEAAERRMRQLLDDAGLPEPDEVDYGEDSIALIWFESKLIVCVDLTEGPDDAAA